MLPQVFVLVLSLAAIAQGAPRIIGGHDAPNHKYPYQVSLRTGYGHFCSGSILNERWILTAAHCVADGPIDYFLIYAGTNFLNETGTVYEAKSIIGHEKWTNFCYYDIALVQVKKDIVFNEFVKPIKVPAEDVQDYSETAQFSGWGRTRVGGLMSFALQEIDLNILTFEQCKKDQTSVTESHICTLTKEGEGICHGDSGGPLVLNGELVGIASYVIPCAVNYPDVYTRVFSYKQWIAEKMQQFSDV